jgi:hypothetical protein
LRVSAPATLIAPAQEKVWAFMVVES